MRRVMKAALLCYALSSPTLAMAAWDAVIDWAKRTELSTATDGVVETVSVKAGERVDKGTVLLKLEQRALRVKVGQGKSDVAHKSLLREEAERELERSKELYARTLLSEHDLNSAKIDFAAADAAYQQSRVMYHEALEALRNSELKAPFDAIVIARRVQPSQVVVTQLRVEPLLIVAAAEQRLARFQVTAAELSKLSPGKGVTVEFAGKRYSGTVESISLESPAKGGRFTVAVLFTTKQAALPGSAAKVSLP